MLSPASENFYTLRCLASLPRAVLCASAAPVRPPRPAALRESAAEERPPRCPPPPTSPSRSCPTRTPRRRAARSRWRRRRGTQTSGGNCCRGAIARSTACCCSSRFGAALSTRSIAPPRSAAVSRAATTCARARWTRCARSCATARPTRRSPSSLSSSATPRRCRSQRIARAAECAYFLLLVGARLPLPADAWRARASCRVLPAVRAFGYCRASGVLRLCCARRCRAAVRRGARDHRAMVRRTRRAGSRPLRGEGRGCEGLGRRCHMRCRVDEGGSVRVRVVCRFLTENGLRAIVRPRNGGPSAAAKSLEGVPKRKLKIY